MFRNEYETIHMTPISWFFAITYNIREWSHFACHLINWLFKDIIVLSGLCLSGYSLSHGRTYTLFLNLLTKHTIFLSCLHSSFLTLWLSLDSIGSHVVHIPLTNGSKTNSDFDREKLIGGMDELELLYNENVCLYTVRLHWVS